MCDAPIASIAGCVSSLTIKKGGLPLDLACTRVNKAMFINLGVWPCGCVFCGGMSDAMS